LKILVGFDNSEASKAALMLAVKHAKTFDAKILLVTSLHGDSTSDLDRTQTAETNLNPAKELVIQKGIPCKSHVLVRGLTPGEDLVNFAKETDSDEIIIGVKKRSRAGKLLFGSNAQIIILNAHRPVVTVK
jgi:nucleotide-binding universal stress UspA family protein